MTIVYRELVGSTTAEVLITDRADEWQRFIEAVTMATKDYFATAVDADAALGHEVHPWQLLATIVQFTYSQG